MTAVSNINPSVFSNFIVQKQPITTQPQVTVKPEEKTSTVAPAVLPSASETISQVEPQQPQVEAQKESSLPSGAKVAIGVALAALAGVGIYVWRKRGARPPVIKPNIQPPVVPPPPPTAPKAKSAVEGVVEGIVEKAVEFKNKIAKGLSDALKSFEAQQYEKDLKNGKTLLLDKNVGIFRIRNKAGAVIAQGTVDDKVNLQSYSIFRDHLFNPTRQRTWRVAEDGSEYIGRAVGETLSTDVKL